jgi:hypothetical protein
MGIENGLDDMGDTRELFKENSRTKLKPLSQ